MIVSTVVNCTCCNGGSGPPPCVEQSPAPPGTKHVKLKWHRPLFFGGEVEFEFDCAWDSTNSYGFGLAWVFQPVREDPDNPGSFLPDPLIFCAPFSPFVYEVYAFVIKPGLCDSTEPRGPGWVAGYPPIVTFAGKGYGVVSFGEVEAVNVDSESPIALSGTMEHTPGCHANPFADADGELDADGNPITSGPGWPVTYIVT